MTAIKGIRIYMEGGFKELRVSLDTFLRDVKKRFTDRNLEWKTIVPGNASETCSQFARDLNNFPDHFCLLLVDSDCEVKTENRWELLRSRPENRLQCPDGATNEQCQLMVQVMETWFAADPETLAAYYGQGFNPRKLPKGNLEAVCKEDIIRKLKDACPKRRPYRKTHSPQILAKLNPRVVRALPHCNRLFETLNTHIHAAEASE